jgi:hypothetical protein
MERERGKGMGQHTHHTATKLGQSPTLVAGGCWGIAIYRNIYISIYIIYHFSDVPKVGGVDGGLDAPLRAHVGVVLVDGVLGGGAALAHLVVLPQP